MLSVNTLSNQSIDKLVSQSINRQTDYKSYFDIIRFTLTPTIFSNRGDTKLQAPIFLCSS